MAFTYELLLVVLHQLALSEGIRQHESATFLIALEGTGRSVRRRELPVYGDDRRRFLSQWKIQNMEFQIELCCCYV